MEKEVWKRIIIGDVESDYYVSNHGKIASYKFKKDTGALVAPYSDKDGYLRVTLRIVKNKNSKFFVHRLVAMFFVEGYKEGLIVNHRDGDKTNPYYENLEWTTHTGNENHAKENYLKANGERNALCIYTDIQVHKICMLLERGLSDRNVSELTGINVKYIARVRKGETREFISKHYDIQRGPGKITKRKEDIDLIIKNYGFDYSTKKILKRLELPINISSKSYVQYRKNKLKKKSSTTIESIYDVDLCDVYTLEEVSLKIRC